MYRNFFYVVSLFLIISFLPSQITAKTYVRKGEIEKIRLENKKGIFFLLFNNGYSLDMIELVEKAFADDIEKIKSIIDKNFNFQQEVKRITEQHQKQQKLIQNLFGNLKSPEEVTIQSLNLSENEITKRKKDEAKNGK